MALLTCRFCGKKIVKVRLNEETRRFEPIEDPWDYHLWTEHDSDDSVHDAAERIAVWAETSTVDLDPWARELGLVPSSSQHHW